LVDGGVIGSGSEPPEYMYAASEKAVDIALEVCPEILGPNAPNCLDLADLWHLLFSQWEYTQYEKPRFMSSSAPYTKKEVETLWNRTLKIIEVACNQGLCPDSNNSPLHALIHIVRPLADLHRNRFDDDVSHNYIPHALHHVGCHRTIDVWTNLIAAASEFNPELFFRPNHNGDLPLHSFLKGFRYVCLHLDGRKYSELTSQEGTLKLLRRIIAANPDSLSTPDAQGRLPLTLACLNHWPIDCFIEEDLCAATVQDPTTGFYPFMSVRTNESASKYVEDDFPEAFKEEMLAVNKSFKLLRLAPHVLSAFCPET
jgi:hypothetical protein